MTTTEAAGKPSFISYAELNRVRDRPGILRVAAYIRVSTEEDDQENSYEAQDRYFTALLQRNPAWTSAGVYSDYGISGTSLENRTGYRRLLRHCQEGKIDRVVCKSISRFARNTRDFMAAMNILHEHQVSILFEKENLDTRDPTSDFILTTLSAIAQEESRSISRSIRWSNQKRFPQGHVRNFALYGYRYAEGENSLETLSGGYQVRRVEIVEPEAEIVRHIFREVADGKSFVGIARELNARHIPAPNQGRKKWPARGRSTTREGIETGWTGEMISSMVGLERYCGDALLQKTYTPDFLTHQSKRNRGDVPQYLVRGHHPAIIDRALFESAQQVKAYCSLCFRNRGPGRTRYAFSGRLVCAGCGRCYNIRNTRANPIWFCPTAALNNGKNACRGEKVYEEQLIRMFRRAFTDRFALLTEPVADNVTAADIMSGRCDQVSVPCRLSGHADDFVPRVMALLMKVQQSDHLERDRCLLKQQINALEQAMSAPCPNIPELQHRQLALKQQLAAQEEYWAKWEYDQEERQQALTWMASLPRGSQGTLAFLNGLTSTYVRAFALSITVHDPLHYTIRWFDDTRTEVEMFSNITDHRCTSAYFDGQRMREKKHPRPRK